MNNSLEDVVLWTGTGTGLNPNASPTPFPVPLAAPSSSLLSSLILFAFPIIPFACFSRSLCSCKTQVSTVL